MSVIINDGHVICPSCNEDIEVKRKSGGGAAYVKNWNKISKQCMDILTVWLSHPEMRYCSFEKKNLRAQLIVKNLIINEDPFNARISELLGLELISSSTQKKSTSHNTRTPPTYKLVVQKVIDILNSGGLV